MTRMMRLVAVAVLAAGLTMAVPPDAPALPGDGPATAAVTDAPDHVVHAGAKDPTDPLSLHMFEGYYPRDIKVHAGDRVRWEFPNQGHLAQAFHTVTFGNPDEIPYVRADELPGALAFDERAFFTMGCGRAGQPVCVLSSPDQFVSSGTPIQHMAGVGKIQPFDAVIDLPEGRYTYFCTLHHPDMQGTVEVVPDDVPVANSKPGDFAAEIAASADAADRTFAERAQPTLTVEAGRRIWTVHTGARSDTTVPVATEAFLPGALNILPRDTVRWVMGGTAHAVTFPDTSAGKGPPQHATLNCEFDGPATGAPGVPGIAAVGNVGLPWCPPGGTIEMGVTPLAAGEHRAQGDAVVTPATLHNSGIMIDGALPERMRGRPAGSGEYFPSEFEATFPVPGTYSYRCMIHWEFMAGTITVGGGQ